MSRKTRNLIWSVPLVATRRHCGRAGPVSWYAGARTDASALDKPGKKSSTWNAHAAS